MRGLHRPNNSFKRNATSGVRLIQALAVTAMHQIVCPHCDRAPSTSLVRFFPWTRLVRHTFTCNLCSGESALPGKANALTVLVGVLVIAACVLALRFWVVASPSGHRSVPWSVGLASFAGFFVLYQLASALTFRHFASHLVPVPPSDS